jgi:hypothetical protein
MKGWGNAESNDQLYISSMRVQLMLQWITSGIGELLGAIPVVVGDQAAE